MKSTSKRLARVYQLLRDPITDLDLVRKLINKAREDEGKRPFDFANRPELLTTGSTGTRSGALK